MADVHQDFKPLLRRFARTDESYAEAWRALRPIALQIGRSRPSYDTVRRFLERERQRLAELAERKTRLARIHAELVVRHSSSRGR